MAMVWASLEGMAQFLMEFEQLNNIMMLIYLKKEMQTLGSQIFDIFGI